MSISVLWARSIAVPVPGAHAIGTVIAFAGQPPHTPWAVTPLFRILESMYPTLLDFWCYAKLGRVRARVPTAAMVTSYGGLSMYTTLTGARSAARKYNLGTHVAELNVPDNGWFGIGPTGRNGHVTIMGDGEHLSRFIAGVSLV